MIGGKCMKNKDRTYIRKNLSLEDYPQKLFHSMLNSFGHISLCQCVLGIFSCKATVDTANI